jgi:hypothetical protein
MDGDVLRSGTIGERVLSDAAGMGNLFRCKTTKRLIRDRPVGWKWDWMVHALALFERTSSCRMVDLRVHHWFFKARLKSFLYLPFYSWALAAGIRALMAARNRSEEPQSRLFARGDPHDKLGLRRRCLLRRLISGPLQSDLLHRRCKLHRAELTSRGEVVYHSPVRNSDIRACLRGNRLCRILLQPRLL